MGGGHRKDFFGRARKNPSQPLLITCTATNQGVFSHVRRTPTAVSGRHAVTHQHQPSAGTANRFTVSPRPYLKGSSAMESSPTAYITTELELASFLKASGQSLLCALPRGRLIEFHFPSSPWWKEPIFCKASGATGCAILRRTW